MCTGKDESSFLKRRVPERFISEMAVWESLVKERNSSYLRNARWSNAVQVVLNAAGLVYYKEGCGGASKCKARVKTIERIV